MFLSMISIDSWMIIYYIAEENIFVADNLYRYAISMFPPTDGLKWIDPKEFDLNKYNILEQFRKMCS